MTLYRVIYANGHVGDWADWDMTLRKLGALRRLRAKGFIEELKPVRAQAVTTL